MDDLDFLRQLSRNPKNRRILKFLILGAIALAFIILLILVAAIILAVKYHTQIYDGFSKTINFVFGDSPQNIEKGVISATRQYIDEFLKNVLKVE